MYTWRVVDDRQTWESHEIHALGNLCINTQNAKHADISPLIKSTAGQDGRAIRWRRNEAIPYSPGVSNGYQDEHITWKTMHGLPPDNITVSNESLLKLCPDRTLSLCHCFPRQKNQPKCMFECQNCLKTARLTRWSKFNLKSTIKSYSFVSGAIRKQNPNRCVSKVSLYISFTKRCNLSNFDG